MHNLKVTAANALDVTMTAELLTGEEETDHGGSGYLGAEKREDAVLRNENGKKTGIKSITGLLRSKMCLSVPKRKASTVSGKSIPSEPKLSTFSLWSRADSITGRRDTEVCENRLPN